MNTLPDEIPEPVRQAKKLLSERCKDYVIAVVYDDSTCIVMSDLIAGHGLASRVIAQIKQDWKSEDGFQETE